MSPDPTDNPFEPPTATTLAAPSPPPLPLKAHPRLTLILWVVWSLMFLIYPFSFLVSALQKGPPPGTANEALVKAFAVVAFLQVLLLVFFRWLFFRFFISRQRLAPNSAMASAVGIVGGLVIFSQVQSIGIYGFILFLQSHCWECYWGFVIPSFILFLLMMPALLLRWRKP
jgi:hypothetical protein